MVCPIPWGDHSQHNRHQERFVSLYQRSKSPRCRGFALDPTGGAYCSAPQTPCWWRLEREHLLLKNLTLSVLRASIFGFRASLFPWIPQFCTQIGAYASKHALGAATHWRHLTNTVEPSMRGGDAACCQISLTTCYGRPA